jgi:hypothetical protein
MTFVASYELTIMSRDNIVTPNCSYLELHGDVLQTMKSEPEPTLLHLILAGMKLRPDTMRKGNFLTNSMHCLFLWSDDVAEPVSALCQALVMVSRHKIPASTEFELGKICTVSMSCPPHCHHIVKGNSGCVPTDVVPVQMTCQADSVLFHSALLLLLPAMKAVHRFAILFYDLVKYH